MRYTATPHYADGSPVMEPDAGRQLPPGKVGRPIEREAPNERRAFLSARAAWVSPGRPEVAPERGCTIRLNGEVTWRYDLVVEMVNDGNDDMVPRGRLDWVDVREERAREEQAKLDAEARGLVERELAGGVATLPDGTQRRVTLAARFRRGAQ